MAPAFPLPSSAGDGSNGGDDRHAARKSFSRPAASLNIDLDSANSSGVGGEEVAKLLPSSCSRSSSASRSAMLKNAMTSRCMRWNACVCPDGSSTAATEGSDDAPSSDVMYSIRCSSSIQQLSEAY